MAQMEYNFGMRDHNKPKKSELVKIMGFFIQAFKFLGGACLAVAWFAFLVALDNDLFSDTETKIKPANGVSYTRAELCEKAKIAMETAKINRDKQKAHTQKAGLDIVQKFSAVTKAKEALVKPNADLDKAIANLDKAQADSEEAESKSAEAFFSEMKADADLDKAIADVKKYCKNSHRSRSLATGPTI